MKVRITTFARPDEDLLKRLLARYNNSSVFWKDIEFVADETYDYLVIFTYPFKQTLQKGYDQKKAITFMTEPSVSYFVKEHPTSMVQNIHLPLPFLPIDVKGSELYGGNGKKIYKTELLSTITSELNGLPGHKARLRFVGFLDALFKEYIDIYGRIHNGMFLKHLKNYKGELVDKFDGLWKYSYHFTCENSFENGYFTEKLIDPIIAESLCFYDGCPNIYEFVDERAYIKIDVQNIKESIEIIYKSIRDNTRKKALPFIKQQKKRFLTDLHPFNLIRKGINGDDLLHFIKIN